MLLSKVLLHLCMITHYTMKENNIAVVTVCALYQKLVTCIYDYELESADGKFRNLLSPTWVKMLFAILLIV